VPERRFTAWPASMPRTSLMAGGRMEALAGTGLLCLVALLSACGTATPRIPSPSELQGAPRVTVSVAAEVDAARVRVFEEQDGRARLRNAVLTELAGSGKRGTFQADEIRITVTRFRLRSTAAGVWVGAMAGADVLEVAVTLTRGNEAVRSYTTGAGGVMAGLIKPSATGRFNGLVELVAKRVVAEL
jgi:hypothetical protein